MGKKVSKNPPMFFSLSMFFCCSRVRKLEQIHKLRDHLGVRWCVGNISLTKQCYHSNQQHTCIRDLDCTLVKVGWWLFLCHFWQHFLGMLGLEPKTKTQRQSYACPNPWSKLYYYFFWQLGLAVVISSKMLIVYITLLIIKTLICQRGCTKKSEESSVKRILTISSF